MTSPRAPVGRVGGGGLSCALPDARFSGYTGHEIQASEVFVVDGLTGHLVRAHATSDTAPGGGATFLILVVDAQHPDGLSAFWAGAVDSDPKALADVEATLADLRVG